MTIPACCLKRASWQLGSGGWGASRWSQVNPWVEKTSLESGKAILAGVCRMELQRKESCKARLPCDKSIRSIFCSNVASGVWEWGKDRGLGSGEEEVNSDCLTCLSGWCRRQVLREWQGITANLTRRWC